MARTLCNAGEDLGQRLVTSLGSKHQMPAGMTLYAGGGGGGRQDDDGDTEGLNARVPWGTLLVQVIILVRSEGARRCKVRRCFERDEKCSSWAELDCVVHLLPLTFLKGPRTCHTTQHGMKQLGTKRVWLERSFKAFFLSLTHRLSVRCPWLPLPSRRLRCSPLAS